MSKFNLTGSITEVSPHTCEVVLTTPDGRMTKIISNHVYPTIEQAEVALRLKMDEILKEFTEKHGVEIDAKGGVKYQ